MKASDSVSWTFLFDLLEVLGFPLTFIIWVRACVTTPKYSLYFNGEAVGFIKGVKGLRQGDPISPYLFVLVMDTLSQMLHYKKSKETRLKYHWRCEKTKTNHLCSANDLMIFFYGDSLSTNLIKDTLNQFRDFTGVNANNDKRYLFMAGVIKEVRDSIKQIFQFHSGSLPLKYLGIPLITSRLKRNGGKTSLKIGRAHV